MKDKRERGDMTKDYKLLTGREQIDYKQFFKSAKNPYDLRGYGMKLNKERPRLNIRNQRVVNGWNRLPATVVNAESVNAFKNAYDRNFVSDMDDRSLCACQQGL